MLITKATISSRGYKISKFLQYKVVSNKKGQVKTYYFESKEDAKHWKMMCEKLRDIFKVEAKYTLTKVKK
jgi:hypothetical protein